jgi:hypothetical protein
MEVVNIPQKYQNDVETAVTYLKNEGCSAIYLDQWLPGKPMMRLI